MSRTPTTHFRVVASDGTRLRAWRNGGSGPSVVLSNGLGAPPAAWPGIADRDSGFDVVGWSHRGLGGSERPEDPQRITVEHHADDLTRVMDHVGMERALVLGWSLGVNVALVEASS